MLIWLYYILKLFFLSVSFLKFVLFYKIFINKLIQTKKQVINYHYYKMKKKFSFINNKIIYYLISLYNYIMKLNNIFLLYIKLHNSIIKIYRLSRILKFNFLYNLKKYAFGIKIKNFFDKFYLLKSYNNIKKNLKDLIYNKVIYKQFYIKKIFSDIKNNSLNKFLNISNNKINRINLNYNKFFYIFFINKKFINKKNKLKRNKFFKNLFSLFFFNLFIYFFLIYLFIFWLNNLLTKIFYINDIFLLKFLQYNKNLFFYKTNFTYNYGYKNKKKEYKNKYFLKKLKLNKYYLIYNKLNSLKFYNIF